jgi:type VI protein secretion system component Hcp
MDKKRKTRKSGAAKSVRDIPVKPLNSKSAKGVRGGKASFNDFSFTHYVDKASPVLMESVPTKK